MTLHIIILAAGRGTRMYSELPKVLHKIANKPLLQHVIETSIQIEPDQIYVVYGHGGDLVKQQLEKFNVNWVHQENQLGTGHAVKLALENIPDESRSLILYGDVPLLTSDTLSLLLSIGNAESFCLLTTELDNPTGYGRIVRNDLGDVEKIVEQKDAKDEQLKLNEINTGILVANSGKLRNWLNQINNHNAQNEFYLTDVIELAVQQNVNVHTGRPNLDHEIIGINDCAQLSQVERIYQKNQTRLLMEKGLTLLDPARFDLRGDLQFGSDSVIDVNVIIEGQVEIGKHVTIGSNCRIKNSKISDNVEILSNCVIENAVIGSRTKIGPFSRIRPDTVLADNVHIGNFVEIKKSSVGQGSKVNHLTYIGDSIIGKTVNVGAGTITCNYDGANKHQTQIGDNAFIGSNSALVAPVKIGKGATIGAGSTITSDTPDEVLTIERANQKSIPGWKRPIKKK